MKSLPKMNVWALKDAFQDLHDHLDTNDVAQLRESCKDWRGVVDSTLSKLAPVNLDCRLITSRLLPSLKALHITELQHLDPQQLLHCSKLQQLTQLHIGGTACSRLKTHHLAWIGRLTNLQDLSISKCSKVKLSILSCCHSLTALQTLTLIGLSVNPNGSSSLNPFLAAGAALTLTSLVLGDQQGLSFLSDGALEGLGELLGPLGRIRVLDLSGCIESTDIGVQHLSGLTSLEHLSLHNCMKIGTRATQTLASFKSLKTLNLRGCSQLRDAQVSPVLKTLTCLESLNLQGCSGIVGTCLNPSICKGLVNLSSLNLSYCQGLTPSVFEGLALLPRLQGLDMSGCNIVSGFQVLAMMSKLTQLTSLQGNYWRCKGSRAAAAASSGCCQQPAALLPPKLWHLSLSHLSCSEAFLETLIAHCPKTLTYLDFSQCLGFGPVSSPDCFQGLSHLRSLQTLKLSSGLGGMPGCVLGFISALENLKDLQLEYVHNKAPAAAAAEVDDVMAAALSSSSSSTEWLQALLTRKTASSSSPSSCIQADPTAAPAAAAAAAAAVEGCQRPRLAAGVAQLQLGTASSSLGSTSSSDSLAPIPVRRILFSQPTNSSSSTVGAEHITNKVEPQQNPRQHGLQGLSQLQNLTVTFSPWVTDQAVAALSGLSCLTSLNLTACQNLTGSGFQAWVRRARSSSRCCCSSTQSRSRSRPRSDRSTTARSADSAIATDPDLDQAARGLRPSLIHLNLTGCGGLTDQGLAAVATACPRLQELLLPGCRGVGDQGVEQLKKLNRLRVLSLASNRSITARSLAALSPQLRHLKKLSLSLCSGICDEALSHMAAAPALTSADLRGCWQITDQGVYSLLSSSRSLLQLNVESCHRLSSQCCPGSFVPGGVPLPDHNSGSSRPGLLVRVAHCDQSSMIAHSVSADLQCNDFRLAETASGPCGAEKGMTAASVAVRDEFVAGVSCHEGAEACAMRFEMFALQQALQQ